MNNSIFKKLISKDYQKPILIAEMSGNHQNSLKGAKLFLNSLLKYKPDIIKFQVYRPDTITLNSKRKDFLVGAKSEWSQYNTLFDLYKKAYTPWKWIEELVLICNRNKLPWFASPFDKEAVDFLEKLNCPAYKLASPEITDIQLVECILETNKPIRISTGLATIEDIDLVIKIIKKKHHNFAILKCTSAYPSPFEDLNLNAIKLLKKKYGCKVGFSDHTLGETASITALALGATIFEKHFKVDDDKSSIDNHFSMNISNLTNYKVNLMNAYKSMGKPSLDIPKSANNNLSGRRSLYVSKPIKKGEKFSEKNIKSVRPSYGLHPKFFQTIIGKKSKRNLKIGARLKFIDID